MKHTTKKLLPALLPALLALFLFPATARAATYEIDKAPGTPVTAIHGDIITTNGAHVDSTAGGPVIAVNTDSGPVTITLKDIDVTSTSGQNVITITGNNNCTIILDGKINLAGAFNSNAIRYNGAGTLIIEGAADSGSLISGGSGIYAVNGSVNISGTTGNISGQTIGIDAGGSVDISGTTGNIRGGSFGINAGGSVSISGTTGDVTGTAYGIYASNGSVDISGTTGDISGSGIGNVGTGIYANGSVNIFGKTGSISGGDLGIYAVNSVMVSGSTGDISGGNYGIRTFSYSVTVSGHVNSISGGTSDVIAGGNTYALLDYTGSLLSTPPKLDPAAYWLVTFNPNGGVGAPVQAYVTQNSVAIPAFAAPTKAGYTFGGWYTDDVTFATQWNLGTDLVTGSMTLYAKWAANPPSGGYYTGGNWYFPPAPAKKQQEAPKPTFPTSGNVVGKRIDVFQLETLKTRLFRLNKGDMFTILGLANGGRALFIQHNGRQGYIALKDIGVTFEPPIKATALKKAAAYIKLTNGKLKRIGYYPKEQTLWIHSISGKYIINKQPDATYYLDAGEWVLDN